MPPHPHASGPGSAAAASSLSEGQSVGRYTIVRRMAAGGMSVLYEATHPVLHTQLVIKTLRSQLRDRPHLVEQFRTEALSASRLRDERLPQIYDIDQLPDGTWYIAMELLHGQDLADRLVRGRLPAGLAVRLATEILEVLARVHRHGIVHRDIKPANVFLARSDLLGVVPKLLDFGIAHVSAHAEGATTSVVGTPSYMAPEQGVEGGRLGPWTDLFAVSAMLFEAIAGSRERPYEVIGGARYLDAVAAGDAALRDLKALVPGVQRGLVDVIAKGLALRAELRWQDAATMVRALEPYCAPRSALASLATPGGDALTDLYDASRPPSEGASTGTGTGASLSDRLAARSKLSGLRSRLSKLRGGAGRPARSADEAPPRPTLRRGERRLVSVVFIETRYGTDGPPLPADDFAEVSAQVRDLLETELREAGADVLPGSVGGIVGLFGFRTLREDDLDRALAAGEAVLARVQEANAYLTEVDYRLSARLGLGQLFIAQRDGDTPQTAARGAVEAAKGLAESARWGGVTLSPRAREALGNRYDLAELEAGAGAAGTAHATAMLSGRRRRLVTADGVFLGRSADLGRLTAVRDTHAGDPARPTAVLVTGPAGIGKSRLVQEAWLRWTRDPDRQATVVHAEPTTAKPFGMLGHLVASLDADTTDTPGEPFAHLLAVGTDAEREALALQLPVLRGLGGAASTALFEGGLGPGVGDRVVSALALLIEAAARLAARQHDGRPLVLSVDNLHRADAASLDILQRVVAHPALQGDQGRPAPLFLLTARDADLLDLSDAAHVVPIRLPPLRSADAAALASALCPDETLGPDARRFVGERSGGNPLFVVELVAGLRDRGLLRAESPRLQRFSAPTSLHGLVLARFERLPPEVRETCRLASVLGVEFEDAVFRHVAAAAWRDGTLPHERPGPQHLEALAARRILHPIDAEPRRWAFAQAPFQAAVYSTVLSDNRRLLHQLTAEALEGLHGDALDRYAPELLDHVSHTDDSRRILTYARRAGRQALNLGAFPDAIEAFSMALALPDRTGPDDPLLDASNRRDLARAFVWSGHLASGAERAEQACAELDVVVGRANAETVDALRMRGSARMLLAEVSLHRGDLDTSVTHAQAAAADFTAAGSAFEAAEASCWQGFALRTAGRVEEGLAHARSGWGVLKDAPNLAVVSRAGHDLGNVLRDVGAYEEAREVFDRAVEAGDALHRLGRKTDAVWGTIAARSGRAITRFAQGDPTGAIEDQRTALDRAEDYGSLPAQAYAGYHLAHHLLATEQLDEAERVATRALDTCFRVGMADRACRCLLLLAEASERRGHVRATLEHLWRAEAASRPLTPALAVRVLEALTPPAVTAGQQRRLQAALDARLDQIEDPHLRARLERLRAHAEHEADDTFALGALGGAEPTAADPALDTLAPTGPLDSAPPATPPPAEAARAAAPVDEGTLPDDAG